MVRRGLWVLALCSVALGGCGGGDDSERPAPSPPRWEHDGSYPVGTSIFELVDTARARTLRVEVWYPAVEAARADAKSGEPIEQLVPEGADRDAYAGLLAAAPAECPTRRTASARDPEPADLDTFPLVVFSHCHDCLRFSGLSIAQRLASHGIAVAAPDHTDNTLFDELNGTAVPLSKEFLQTRALDVRFVLDVLLAGTDANIPDALRGRFDTSRVGVLGHSFGGVTTGLVLEDDPRPVAGMSIAAPVQNPLLPGVTLANVQKPLLFLVAKEDNSITEIGNNLIRDNFADANPPVWKLEVDDAGHWSFSDVCGLTDGFSPGCGEGTRQTVPGETFQYLPVKSGLQIASSTAAAFFSAELFGDPQALSYLAKPQDGVSVEVRE
ncbi:MAG: dienelactone hydrolase family protein [Polyangiaceae bacterium]|nr:dienelactone hydrolase family protein [Polyangiaceae bacterium]